ncbi:MAG: hypothetical protein AAF438_10620 [Pseudomonadota bacterium]
MSPLTRKIEGWCDELRQQPGVSDDWVDEIKDHLYCDVLDQIEKGQDGEAAFVAATQRLGDQATLSQEFYKNRSILYRLVHKTQSLRAKGVNMTRKGKKGATIIAHALMFAAAMLVSAKLLQGTEHGDTILYVFLGLWVGTSMLMGDYREQMRCEWEFLKGLFGAKS